jgi:hydroxymethylbilane synthase
MRKLIIGSRQSELAITQTRWVMEQLLTENPDLSLSIKEIVTKGDKILDKTLSKVGGKGLFVKEIEQALLNGDADFAVHSMKDLPARMPKGLVIAAVTAREEPQDALVSQSGRKLAELPAGAVIGTSSLRRAAQLLAARPDCKIEPLRGNVNTRMRRLREGDFDAIILAAAGLRRMGWQEQITELIPFDVCLPAVGQGALAIQCREDDDELIRLLKRLHDKETGRTVAAERSFLAAMDGNCQIPIGGYARLDGNDLYLMGFIGSPDGSEILRDEIRGADPIALGADLAKRLNERGAQHILQALRKELET